MSWIALPGRKRWLATKVRVGFALALGILLGIGWASHRTITEFQESVRAVSHTYEFLHDLDVLQSMMRDAETGQRGFLLTDNREYLDPYTTSVPLVAELTKRLRLSAGGDPRLLQTLDRLESLISWRLIDLKAGIELREQQDRAAAVAHVRTDEGKRIMDEARRVAGQISAEQLALLDQRKARTETTAARMLPVILLGSVLGFVFVLGAVFIINSDIRERVRAEEELEQFFAVSVDFLAITTVDGYFVRLNRAWEKLLSTGQGERACLLDFIHADDRQGMAAALRKARDGAENVYLENRWRTQSGGYRWLAWNLSLLKAQNMICVGAHDITVRREAERAEDEFVSMVSHEVRTPLTSIRAALGLLAAGLLQSQPERGQRMLEIALSNTQRLTVLINDILDLERIKSGKMSMHKRECRTGQIAGDAVEAMKAMAEKAGVKLERTGADVPLVADPDRILQTVANLVSNAIKFSPAGSTVSVGSGCKGSVVEFRIQDQGRGIPADQLERVFERFHQVKTADAREKGGSGLGLPICRAIVEQHGGRIWVESKVGEGSTFIVALPQDASAVPAAAAGESDAAQA